MTDFLMKLSTVLFGCAVVHTFFSTTFLDWSHHFKKNSVPERALHLLSEIEVTFGLWAGVWIIAFALYTSETQAIDYLETLNFTEPLFVLVIMLIASTRPIQWVTAAAINFLSAQISNRIRSLTLDQSFYWVTLSIGPLLGSIITEPAAMTVIAILLRDRFFNSEFVTQRTRYVLLAILFVNISIGGLLTHFAAPPVVMVATKWGWNTSFMLNTFGWKAIISIFLNTLFGFLLVKNDLNSLNATAERSIQPFRKTAVASFHGLFLFLAILSAHRPIALFAVLIAFLGLHQVTALHQDRLQLKESFLVGFFLAGLVVLGNPQSWWLQPLLENLNEVPLFIGAAGLTAITDNAALTYLGAQVEGLSDPLKYALVSGAVTGGGLTVIANAPNPAGYGILKDSFGESGLQPARLFLAAITPTCIAAACFLML
jgi:hypothetical protein